MQREVKGAQEVNSHIDTHNMIYAHVCEGRNTRVIVNMRVCHAPPPTSRMHVLTSARTRMCVPLRT